MSRQILSFLLLCAWCIGYGQGMGRWLLTPTGVLLEVQVLLVLEAYSGTLMGSGWWGL
ncbi:SURF1 family protein [Sesbania bispinosa]|nr:SURF1 family protein [Sesbania bispinosa]